MRELILAHDLGTTGNKATLFDAAGHMLASVFVGYDTAYPQAGWAEQDPADWWRAVCLSSQQLLERVGPPGAEIAVLSFSGEMMSCLPVDDGGRPLRTAIIWADQRADGEAAMLVDRVGAERTYQITGHRASASYTAAKLLWVRAHQPEIYARTHKVLQAKDYAAYRLTGVYATDYSDASGTNLFDLRARRWSEEMLGALEIPAEMLPPAHPSATVIGCVTREAAESTGLAEGTPGGHRQRRRRLRHGGGGRAQPWGCLYLHRLVRLDLVCEPRAAVRSAAAHRHLCPSRPGLCLSHGVDAGRGRSLRLAGTAIAGRRG